MGNIAMESGRTAGAINIFRRLLALKINLNDEKGIIQTNLLLSKLYLDQKNYDSAHYFNAEVNKLAGTDKDVLTEAAIQDLIILSFQGKIKEAGDAKGHAEQLLGLQPNPTNRIRLLAAITNYYMAQKNTAMVEKYFDSTATLITESRSVEMAASGLQLLADMSSQNGDYKTAYRMMRSMNMYKDIFRSENIERISAEIKNYADSELKEKEIEYLSLVNKLKEEKLSKEELKRMALLRENILKDSSLANQQLLMAAMKTESVLRNEQLEKEKELRLSLSRENELKQQMLTGERKSKKLLWVGLGAMTLLVTTIFYLFKKQQYNNRLIRKQSAELEVLNKEIHHRVKNNLQVISSMLDLQSQSLQDEKASAIIREGIQRVQSMAFIHQNLYQGNAVNSVNMQEYIRMLSNHLFQTYNIRTDKIQLHTYIEDLGLHTDTAIPLGMILNELISNSLKYAFKGREKGDIWITMKKSEQELFLAVKDNGTGLPPGFNPETITSFGYEIIRAFAQKMKARMNISGDQGTEVQLIISKFKTTA
jgi:two-component sensor histidine kinase